MSQSNPVERFLFFLIACTIASVGCAAQSQPTQAASDLPVGRWVAEHPSKGGIGSWWDFRFDGTLTLYIGAMVSIPFTRSGDTLTMPSGTIGGPPSQVKFRVQGNNLYLGEKGTESLYTRLGIAPSASDALLGKWKPSLPSSPSADPKAAALEKARSNGVCVFTSDGIERVRIPFVSREGTWDIKDRTFQFPDSSVVYSFQVLGTKLVLAQPPDGRETDTYLKDPVY